MLKINFEKNKIICMALCFVALIGFVLPAINLNIDFFGNSNSMNFSVLSLFDKKESQFAGMELSQTDLFNLSGNKIFEDLFADIGIKLIPSIGAYFITLILLIVVIAFMFIGKFKKSINIMLTVSLAIFAYTGNTILSVTEILYNGLESSLGFLAIFFDISDLLKINLGSGYWLTLSAVGCALLMKIVFYIYSKYSSKKIIQSTKEKILY